MKNSSLLLAFLLLGMAAKAVTANYTSKTRVCSGMTITLTSTSTGANAFYWLVDGDLYSTSPDTTIIFSTPCSDNHTVTLVAMNMIGCTTDTFTKTISVFNGTCAAQSGMDYTGCYGDTFAFYSYDDATANLWTFSEPQQLISGCDTCDHVKFLLTTNELDLYNTVTYEGGCQELIVYNHTNCPGGWLSIEDVEEGAGITIAPNPFSDRATLTFPNATGKKYTFQLYNTEGRLVRRIENITSGQLELSRDGLSAGSYFYHLSCPDSRAAKGRIFIQ